MKRVLMLALASMLAACAMGPDYKRPEVKTPDSFRGQSAQLDEKSLADLAWWDLYRDPVLEKLVKIALQRTTMSKSRPRVSKNFRAAGISIGSIPQVSAVGSATRSRISTVANAKCREALRRCARPTRWKSTCRMKLICGGARELRQPQGQIYSRPSLRDTARVTVVSSVQLLIFTLRTSINSVRTERTVATRENWPSLPAQFNRGGVGLDANRAGAQPRHAAIPIL
jgi:multidrug efflux system outer membrane protein